jgi:hypothetical protein
MRLRFTAGNFVHDKETAPDMACIRLARDQTRHLQAVPRRHGERIGLDIMPMIHEAAFRRGANDDA